MNKEYKINNIYNDNGSTLNKAISKFLSNFLDNELNFVAYNNITKSDIILNN